MMNNCVDSVEEEKKFLKNRKILAICLYIANFWIGVCYSLPAPFFPREAEHKNATETVYGLIIGTYEFGQIVGSPIFAKLVRHVSPKILVELGLALSGLSSAIFGLPGGLPFILAAFIVRFCEGIGCAAFKVGAFSVIFSEFKENSAVYFSLFGTCSGVGLILGSVIGSGLYELNGYYLPFVALGFSLFFMGIITHFAFINAKYVSAGALKSGKMIKFLSHPSAILGFLLIATTYNFVGFNTTTIEPYLRQFTNEPMIVGLIITVFGLTFTVTYPLWGKLINHGADPVLMAILGCLICSIGYLFLGPESFLPIEPKLWLYIVSLVLIALGMGPKALGGFLNVVQEAKNVRGFPDDVSTHGMAAAFWIGSIAIGASIGPSLGGFLVQNFGYRRAIIVSLILDSSMILLLLTYFIWKKQKSSSLYISIP